MTPPMMGHGLMVSRHKSLWKINFFMVRRRDTSVEGLTQSVPQLITRMKGAQYVSERIGVAFLFFVTHCEIDRSGRQETK